jgi:hypothetical protein
LASCSLSAVGLTDVWPTSLCALLSRFMLVGGLLRVGKHVLILIFSCENCQIFTVRCNEVCIGGESLLYYSTHVISFDRLLWLSVSVVFFASALVPVNFISDEQKNDYINDHTMFIEFNIALPDFISCSVTHISYFEYVCF